MHRKGAVGKRPLADVLVQDKSRLCGPWPGSGAVQAFHTAGGIEISGQTAISFTHGDLVGCNVLVTPGPKPRVASVIDWAQAGWYPSYWEWCKAKWVDVPAGLGMDDAAQREWRLRYLPLVVDPLPDDTIYYPWMRFAMANL